MKKFFFALALTFAIFASSSAQLGITGPTTIYEGVISVWYPTNIPAGTQYVRMWISTLQGDITWPENQYQFDSYGMTPSGTGRFLVGAVAEPSHDVVYYGWVYVEENPAPVPPTPTITGPSSCSVSQYATYSMPSGKQDYSWILPYGSFQVQKYNNLLVLGWYYTGNKTVQGKYKEGGVWSEYGLKTTSVY